MKYPVRRFKSLEVALKEMEPFVRDGAHLQSGKRFKQLGDMRSREILANWLVCVTINAVNGQELMFSSDPIGGDGIIQDGGTGETWATEHVMVPSHAAGKDDDAKSLILKAIEQKRTKGGAAYAEGKTLVVFLMQGLASGILIRLRAPCQILCCSPRSGWSVCKAFRTENTSTV